MGFCCSSVVEGLVLRGGNVFALGFWIAERLYTFFGDFLALLLRLFMAN